MWVFLNNAFLSIVALKGAPDRLSVRARFAGDIERVFPGAVIEESPERDYRFRAAVWREEAALVLADALEDISYPNFKDSVRERWRHDTYLAVWRTMHQAQVERCRAVPAGRPRRSA